MSALALILIGFFAGCFVGATRAGSRATLVSLMAIITIVALAIGGPNW